MKTSEKKLFVVAGEPSGDERAAEVINQLKLVSPRIHVLGMGGPALRSAGLETVNDIADTAVFGLTEALRALGRFRRIKNKLEKKWIEEKPDAALLVDFGGFNLRFAQTLKKHGARVAYYISPQVWASRPGRIRRIRSLVDLMLVLFQFEEELYRKSGVHAVHVGHPLVETVKSKSSRSEVCRQLGFKEAEPVIGFMPGSRSSELRRLLPGMLRTAKLLSQRDYAQHLAIAAPGLERDIQKSMADLPIAVVSTDRYSAMGACDLLIIASGTAALEAALLGRPAIVVYRTSAITAALGKLLLRIPYVSLPNIIAGEEVYPEFLQARFKPEPVAEEAIKILEDTARYDRIRAQTEAAAGSLGKPGAAKRAAEHLAEFLHL